MTVTLDSKRRLTLPAGFLKTHPGELFDAHLDEEDGSITLRRTQTKLDWLSVWMECPVMADDIPPRSGERPKKLNLDA